MALLGNGALAMWWDMSAEHLSEFEDWHSHEHFPERLGIPGFVRASRWSAAGGADRFFVMYELQSYDTLMSPGYLERLNAPTPWSVKMMPHHRNMVRSQCRVIASHGGGTAGHALTVRFSPQHGRADALAAALIDELPALTQRPGLTGAHLLRTDTPGIAATTEQMIRGGDRAADWICLVTGYDPVALDALARTEMSSGRLAVLGAQPGSVADRHVLRFTAIAADMR